MKRKKGRNFLLLLLLVLLMLYFPFRQSCKSCYGGKRIENNNEYVNISLGGIMKEDSLTVDVTKEMNNFFFSFLKGKISFFLLYEKFSFHLYFYIFFRVHEKEENLNIFFFFPFLEFIKLYIGASVKREGVEGKRWARVE